MDRIHYNILYKFSLAGLPNKEPVFVYDCARIVSFKYFVCHKKVYFIRRLASAQKMADVRHYRNWSFAISFTPNVFHRPTEGYVNSVNMHIIAISPLWRTLLQAVTWSLIRHCIIYNIRLRAYYICRPIHTWRYVSSRILCVRCSFVIACSQYGNDPSPAPWLWIVIKPN